MRSQSGTRFALADPCLARQYAYLFAIAVGVVVADQASKAVVRSTLSDGRVVSVLGGAIHLDYARNTGIAFSMFPSGGIILALVAIVASIAIVAYYSRTITAPMAVRLGLALVLGGALGNLIDRLRLGYVVDFIDLRWWPVFNLADSSVVIGVAVLIIHSTLQPSKPADRG